MIICQDKTEEELTCKRQYANFKRYFLNWQGYLKSYTK